MELVSLGSDRTDLIYRMARPRAAKDQAALMAMEGNFRQVLMDDGGVLIKLAAADARERAAGRSAEPTVPASATRNLSEPTPSGGAPIA
jgi:hypothetical protein